MKNGIELIAYERERQIKIEGWSIKHDSHHEYFELTKAAICYANQATMLGQCIWQDRVPYQWPFSINWWKPLPKDEKSNCPLINTEDSIKMLTRAGALIAAEIDRLQNELKQTSHEQK